MITASIVLKDAPRSDLDRLYRCIRESSLRPRLYIINNSRIDIDHPIMMDCVFTYIKNERNIGYGGGHNVAIRMISESSEFHFVLNADIQFGPLELEKMIYFMRENRNVGQMMPRVIYEDGSPQYLCRLLPTPADVFLRRFAPAALKRLMSKRIRRYELQLSGYSHMMDVPFLSGCFMLFRVSALRDIGLFDERYFMYAEDVDLTRRMHAKYRTVYFPGATIMHSHARGSYKSGKLLLAHMHSLVRYFSKWGWLFDAERKRVNRETLLQFERKHASADPESPGIWRRDRPGWNE